jgi:predicted small lipoprotein YifL
MMLLPFPSPLSASLIRRVCNPAWNALLLSGLLFLAGCGGKEPASAPSAEAQVAAQVEPLLAAKRQIEQQQAALTPRKNKWTYGNTVSELTGYFDGTALRLIEEQMSMGDLGSVHARYFYTPEGRLFAYDETKETRSGTAANAVKTEQGALRLFFRENGTLLSGERTVDGKAAPLSGIEEQAVRMHDKELQAVLESTPPR